jgi:hypothetical protein
LSAKPLLQERAHVGQNNAWIRGGLSKKAHIA